MDKSPRHSNQFRWLALLGMMFATPLLAASPASGWDALPMDRLIVKFKPDASSQVAKAISGKQAIPALQRLADRLPVATTWQRTIANGSHLVRLQQPRDMAGMRQVIQELMQDPDVAFVEPDLRMFPAATPDDSLYASQWSLQDPVGGIAADLAWDISLGEGAVVAVLDTGVRRHEDLKANLLDGYDFVSDAFLANDGNGRDGNPVDPGDGVAANGCANGIPSEDQPSTWHGTHVAGIIAAVGFNGIGVTGVAPSASVLPLRVLGRCGGYTSDVADAIYWAAGYSVSGVPANPTPARVINMSLSSTVQSSCSQTYSDAITAARDAGVLVVAAAGNSSDNADLYPPGNCTGVLSVAATNRQGGRAGYSNFGATVDLAAPGGNMTNPTSVSGILSTANAGRMEPGADNYVYYQGTSMAAPHVAGVAALLFAAKPQAEVAEVETALKSTARPFPLACDGCGAGIVDAEKALQTITGAMFTSEPADLSLVLKSTNGQFIADPANPGQGTISFSAEVTNMGPEAATNVTLTNKFPDTVSLESIAPSQGFCAVSGESCSLGELATGQMASVAILVRTTNDQKMEFQAQVLADQFDPDQSNNFVLKKMGGALDGLLLPLALLLLRRKRLLKLRI